MRNKGKYLIICTILTVSGLLLGACGVDRAGIEIGSQPLAKVYIDGKELGMTPYKNNNLTSGEVSVKMVDSLGKSFEKKVRLEKNVTTVMNYDFEEVGNESGYTLYMEKNGENPAILVNSQPENASIKIAGEIKGAAPAKIRDIGVGDKEVVISFPGYKSLSLMVKAVKGYQLVIDAKLGREVSAINTPAIIPTPASESGQRVKILETETGWLRVREEASSGAAEVGRVNPGESYVYTEEKSGWYKINFSGKTGWISSKYAEKISE